MIGTVYNAASEPLTFDDLTRTMIDFRAKYGRPLKVIKVSEETLRWIERSFPIYPSSEIRDTLYGVPIQVDNDLALFECQPIYV